MRKSDAYFVGSGSPRISEARNTAIRYVEKKKKQRKSERADIFRWRKKMEIEMLKLFIIIILCAVLIARR